MIAKNKHVNKNGLYELRIKPVVNLFYNEGFGIYICSDLDENEDEITVVGNMPKLIIGKIYICHAEITVNKKYGEQFKSQIIYSNENNSKEDEQMILSELTSGSIYENIIKAYEMPITAILEGNFDCTKVKGIGKVRYEELLKKVKASQMYMRAMAELSRYGIHYNVVVKIVKKYGSSETAIEKIKENPYVLYHDIDGIGFQKADMIAKSIGINDESPKRKLAGLIYALELEQVNGNTWGHREIVKQKMIEILGVCVEDFDVYLQNQMFVYNDTIVAMKRLYQCEKDISDLLHKLNELNQVIFSEEKVSQIVNNMEKSLGVSYALKQKSLFYEVAKKNIVVLVGKAGSGKTLSLNGCLKMLDMAGLNMVLVSPTAQAAKVLKRATNRPAKTIHRTLEGTIGMFTYNADCRMDCDVVIIDEASMVDIFLFRSLLLALPDRCKIILVGDPAQLESVAVGNVLFDVVNSGAYSVVALDQVFRQALDSGILQAATSIDNGDMFDVKGNYLEISTDFKLWFGEKEESADRVSYIYEQLLSQWDLDDILVISPMKRGESGVANLNVMLQNIANSPSGNKKEIVLERGIFREGDRVRHTKNDYKADWLDPDYNKIRGSGVFNGDFGIIKEISSTNEIYVDFGDMIIEYKKPYKDLYHAYCITCHSSQGSQAKVVIGVVDISHYMNLKRNLLYTMVTRAEKRMYLVAQKKALSMAIKNNTIPKKQTFLELLIRNN